MYVVDPHLPNVTGEILHRYITHMSIIFGAIDYLWYPGKILIIVTAFVG